MMVGTDAQGVQWREVAAKLPALIRDVVACGAAFPTRIRLFAIHCTSLVRHRAQFCRPEQTMLRAYRAAAQRILARMGMPLVLIHNADLLFLPASVLPAEKVWNAASWTLAGSSGVLGRVWEDYDRMLASDAAALAVLGGRGPQRRWRAHSSITAMLREGESERRRRIAAGVMPEEPTQKQWMRVLRSNDDARRAELAVVLRRRCALWAPLGRRNSSHL